MGRGQVGYSLWSHKELNTTRQLTLSLSLLTYNSMLVPVTQYSDLIFLYISKCEIEYRGDQVKMTLLRWVLIPYDWCPYKQWNLATETDIYRGKTM